MNEIKTILACVRTADKKYNLINPNDRIAVGISGGKDSMILFYALHIYTKFQHKNFKIKHISFFNKRQESRRNKAKRRRKS